MISIHQIPDDISGWDKGDQFMFAIKNGRDSSVMFGGGRTNLGHCDDKWYTDYTLLVWSST